MYAFQVYQDEIANLQLPLTKLETLPSVDPKKVDSLLCVGNFNALAVIRDGKVREYRIRTIKFSVAPSLKNDLSPHYGCLYGSTDCRTIHKTSAIFRCLPPPPP